MNDEQHFHVMDCISCAGLSMPFSPLEEDLPGSWKLVACKVTC